MLAFLFIVIAFLIGSIPTGYIVGRAYGIDIRQHGSGNIGATNINRVLGKRAGSITLALDFLKGALPTLVLPYVYTQTISEFVPGDIGPFIAIACILGHCYSPFLGFNGGKGVATSLGAFLVIVTIPTLIALAVFVVIQKTTSYVSLGSISAAFALPLSIYLLRPQYSNEALLIAILGALLVVWRHKSNILRLIKKDELKPSKENNPN